MNHTLTFVRRHPALAWIVALAFFLATPFPPAPWTVSLGAQQNQFALNNTTTAAAVVTTDTTISLTSASAIASSSFGAPAAGQCLYIASPTGGELMRILSISSTTATVQRQNPRAHASLTRLFTGACSAFRTSDPPPGSCTASLQPLPWINTNNGNVARCMGSTGWSITNATAITYNSVAPGLPW